MTLKDVKYVIIMCALMVFAFMASVVMAGLLIKFADWFFNLIGLS
jgi:hypothetical protein